MIYALMDRQENQAEGDIQSLRIDRGQEIDLARDSRRGLLLPVILLAVALAISLFLASRLEWSARLGLTPKEVQVASAVRRWTEGARPVLTAGGYVIARNQVEVGSKITGRIMALEVDEGDFVRKGQVIARLDDREIAAQVRQSQANLAAARARLAELEAGSRQQEIDRAKAEMDRAEAELRNAEVNLRRYESLFEQGLLERQNLDDARARYEMAVAAQHAAKESYDLVRMGPRQEEIDRARAEVRRAEAELALAQAQLENTVIRAPISGTVLERYVDPGEMVTIGFASDRGAKQALVALANLEDLQIELDISEADIARVQLDQPTSIAPDAYPERRYKGTVEYIASVGNRQKATVKVKVRVLDPDEHLRPDMGAKVTFYEKGSGLPERESAIMVPKSAVVERGGRTVVFLARDSKVVVQSVRVRREEEGYVEIISGLEGGEKVIVGGQESLKDGDMIAARQ